MSRINLLYFDNNSGTHEWRRSDRFDIQMKNIVGGNLSYSLLDRYIEHRHFCDDETYIFISVHTNKITNNKIKKDIKELKKHRTHGSILYYPSMLVVQI